MNLKKIIILVPLAILASCQKTGNTEAQPDEVTIEISSPGSGAVYKKGDIVDINAEISYTGMMHGYIIRISDDAGNTIYEDEGHSHGDFINIKEQWTDTLSSIKNLQLEITAVINHDESLKNAKVAFKSQP